jgi:hypothetical protein
MDYDWGPDPLWLNIVYWVILVVTYGLAFGTFAYVLSRAGCPMWPY